MSVLNQISYYQNRRDEIPNQELARALAETKNVAGIQEIASNLHHKNHNVQSDCLKVLYEIGYINPDLIKDYVDDFLRLLKSKSNRMVWGGMIALATIADKKPAEIWDKLEDVIQTTNRGTVITMVWGIKTLAKVASTNREYRQRIFPILLRYLRTCIPRDVPIHAESTLCAVDETNRGEFRKILEARQVEMTSSQLTRLKKILKQLDVMSR